MRTLTITLEAAQKKKTLDPRVKITLTQGENEYIYEQDRILSINPHTEEPYRQNADVVLDNSDGVLTDLDLKGYQTVIADGLITKAGAEYSNTAPLWVVHQELSSSPGKLTCELRMVGIPNLLAEDRASANYKPASDDTKTVKDIINDMFDGTMAAYDHCTTYTVDWDSEDSLIDVYTPKDGFRIYVNGSRLAALRRLLDYTKCVPIFDADGHITIIQPTITGSTYDYEYSLADTYHTFFAKAYRKTLVIPNYIVVKSNPNDNPQYSGYAKDTESNDLLDIRQYERTRLASNDQADDIAEAILSKYQLNAEMGAAEVPMNVGAEVFDYVKVTDARENDNRVGNIGSIVRTYKPGQYSMKFSFGGWLSVRGLFSNLEVYPTGAGTVGAGSFERLYAKDAYIENLSIDQIVAVWLDPDSNIDLSQIGDTLDSLPDGEVYARVKSLHLSAEGGIKLDENILYSADYDPTEKFDLGDDDLDDIPEGTTYQRVLATHIDAGKIKLSSLTVIDGLWYSESGVDIDANQGINIYGVANALTTRATKTGTIQCYVGADGKIYAGGGNTYLDADGITILGERLRFFYGATNVGFIKASTATQLLISTGSQGGIQLIGTGADMLISGGGAYGTSIAGGKSAPSPGPDDLYLCADDDVHAKPDDRFYIEAVNIDLSATVLRPTEAAGLNLGSSTYYWNYIYYKVLSDEGCPTPALLNPLDKLLAMKTKKRFMTLKDVEKEGMGSRARDLVEAAGGQGEFEEWDRDTFPPEIMIYPTEEAYRERDEIHKRNINRKKRLGRTLQHLREALLVETKQARRQNIEEKITELEERLAKPLIKPEPKIGVSTTDQISLIVKAVQELANKVEILEAG